MFCWNNVLFITLYICLRIQALFSNIIVLCILLNIFVYLCIFGSIFRQQLIAGGSFPWVAVSNQAFVSGEMASIFFFNLLLLMIFLFSDFCFSICFFEPLLLLIFPFYGCWLESFIASFSFGNSVGMSISCSWTDWLASANSVFHGLNFRIFWDSDFGVYRSCPQTKIYVSWKK